MLDAEGLAEGEEPETNILRVVLRKSANCCVAVRRRNCGISRSQIERIQLVSSVCGD